MQARHMDCLPSLALVFRAKSPMCLRSLQVEQRLRGSGDGAIYLCLLPDVQMRAITMTLTK